MFEEEDLLPISALSQLLYCERRAALIYVEGLWNENLYTAEGHHLHDRAHLSDSEVRGVLRIVRGLYLRSLRLGLTGKADVVEFHRLREDMQNGTRIEGVSGFWRPFPVEYKRGRLRHEREYEVQLCAQALCLEEMLSVNISSGALYYGKTARRLKVAFDDNLRRETEEAARSLHDLCRKGETPRARYEKKCNKCSMRDLCMPKTTGVKRNVMRYLNRIVESDSGEES
ncbi:CRISPR-associated protein Cas4 [candidate division TA06 bacterium B3_TA06]|uniref:CRISPR-associated exonuclease Cas4 n=1 Tax=candidate division TA06 bacterium B3_TA06 TaxID=2012487 RepID=A0A532V1V3_UNCT6|nr:MAG: CRISPR-associated protein Cas4 [candidate division TA06 bacterium B3_TA06]